jgi:predicted enzyme related to lactoylglutathione lyase
MTIKNALAGVAVGQIDSAVIWYSKVIGRSPDSRPMDGLAEFSFDNGGWLQIYEDQNRVGKSSVTLAVSDLDEQVRALRELGVDVGDMSKTDYVATAIVNDPDGNQVVFAESLSSKNRALQ